jgi:hypothetical protein
MRYFPENLSYTIRRLIEMAARRHTGAPPVVDRDLFLTTGEVQAVHPEKLEDC